jgi:hypothetical protein
LEKEKKFSYWYFAQEKNTLRLKDIYFLNEAWNFRACKRYMHVKYVTLMTGRNFNIIYVTTFAGSENDHKSLIMKTHKDME